MHLLQFDEAAKAMSVSVSTLRYWVATGQAPPSARVGKRRMFKKEDVDAWIASKFANVYPGDVPCGDGQDKGGVRS